MATQRIPVFERLMKHVVVDLATGCWLFNGGNGRSSTGYAFIADWSTGVSKTLSAHIVSYLHFKGEIPTGLHLDHTCHDPKTCSGGPKCLHRKCVNPNHLEAVTRSVNVLRGCAPKVASEAHKKITHCPSGHEYTNANTRFRPDGISRVCMACNRIRTSNRRADFRLLKACAEALRRISIPHPLAYRVAADQVAAMGARLYRFSDDAAILSRGLQEKSAG